MQLPEEQGMHIWPFSLLRVQKEELKSRTCVWDNEWNVLIHLNDSLSNPSPIGLIDFPSCENTHWSKQMTRKFRKKTLPFSVWTGSCVWLLWKNLFCDYSFLDTTYNHLYLSTGLCLQQHTLHTCRYTVYMYVYNSTGFLPLPGIIFDLHEKSC